MRRVRIGSVRYGIEIECWGTSISDMFDHGVFMRAPKIRVFGHRGANLILWGCIIYYVLGMWLETCNGVGE